MKAIFVMIKCEMGRAYRVAREMADGIPELSEMHSTSGQYDLLGKFYLEPDQDIGLFVVETRAGGAGREGHLHAADLQRLLRARGLKGGPATKSPHPAASCRGGAARAPRGAPILGLIGGPTR